MKIGKSYQNVLARKMLDEGVFPLVKINDSINDETFDPGFIVQLTSWKDASDGDYRCTMFTAVIDKGLKAICMPHCTYNWLDSNGEYTANYFEFHGEKEVYEDVIYSDELSPSFTILNSLERQKSFITLLSNEDSAPIWAKVQYLDGHFLWQGTDVTERVLVKEELPENTENITKIKLTVFRG